MWAALAFRTKDLKVEGVIKSDSLVRLDLDISYLGK